MKNPTSSYYQISNAYSQFQVTFNALLIRRLLRHRCYAWILNKCLQGYIL